MRLPPPLSAWPRFPVIAGTALLAIGVTIAKEMEVSGVTMLYEDAHIGLGEYWRLLTSILPHGNLIHLFFNVYWLWVLGTFLEETFGHAAAIGLVVLFGIGSAGAEYSFLEGGIGLSGVVYGQFGMLWMLSLYDRRYRDVVDQNTITLFVAWFFICIVATYTGVMAIANLAHGVGGLLGVLVGWGIARPRFRIASLAAAMGLCGVFFLLATLWRTHVNLSPSRGADEERVAYEAIKREDYARAEKLLRTAIALNPQRPHAWHNLGVVLIATGRIPEGEEALGRAAALKSSADHP